MNTNRTVLALAGILVMNMAQAQQFWNRLPGGNVINATEWLGADAGSTVPLRIETRANQPIHWYTRAIRRMLLTEHLTNQTINTFTGIDRSGFLGVGPFPNPLVNRPFTFIHIDDGGQVDSGYRPWMRQGTMITHGSDFSYFGMKDEGHARNHTVIAWSDNDIWDPGPDYMKFIFTSYLAQNGAAGTVDGLEAARFTPDATGDLVYFGLGDWFNSGGQQPDERLDLLDRTIRLRDFSTAGTGNYLNQTSSVNRVLVADANDGRVYWRPMSDFNGQTDCDWTVSGGSDVVTGYLPTPPPGCPGLTSKVGIGTASPTAKLEVTSTLPVGVASSVSLSAGNGRGVWTSVVHSGSTGSGLATFGRSTITTGGGSFGDNRGGHFMAEVDPGASVTNNVGSEASATGANVNYAIRGSARSSLNSPYQNYGFRGDAAGAEINFGALGRGRGTGNCNNYGGFFIAGEIPGNGTNTGTNYGIWAEAVSAPNLWAGWFKGDVWITQSGFVNGGVQIISDATLKTNVQSLGNGASVISMLEPRTYEFIPNTLPHHVLPTGPQAGFIAQEVEVILPNLVKEALVPEELDSLGNVIAPAQSIKTVNYTGIIPYLVAAFNEQETRIAQLEQDLASCCTYPLVDGAQHSIQTGSSTIDVTANDTRLTIAPNPFQEQTTISYTLEGNARVQLQVSNQGGLHIATLRDQQQEEGAYSLTWHTADLAPGTYIVTLFADGAPVVKRAVKVK